jgi:MFS transporter, DHA1 family, multidrug resistance protein
MRKDFLFLSTLVMLISLSQIVSTVLVSTISKISLAFSLVQGSIESVISLFFLGFALGMLFWGIFSDYFGKKTSLIFGIILYVLSSLLYVFAWYVLVLKVSAFIQGFGVSVCSVMAQALLRDFLSQDDRRKLFNKINIALSFIPALGMYLGSVISNVTNWRYVFGVLVLLGLVILIKAIFAIPKIALKIADKNFFIALTESIIKILHDGRGLSMGFLIGGSMGLMFCYLTESSFYFLNMHNFSTKLYELVSFGIFIPMLLGSLIVKFVAISQDRCVLLGIRIISLASIELWFANYYSLNVGFSVVGFYFILMGIYIIIPNCLSQILENYGKYTGTAASLYGLYYYAITSVFIAVLGNLHKLLVNPLPIFFCICSILFIIMYKIMIIKKQPIGIS